MVRERDRKAKKQKTKDNENLESVLKKVNKDSSEVDVEVVVERNTIQEKAFTDMKKRKFPLISFSLYQVTLLNNSNLGVEEKFPTATLINEMKIMCSECKTAVHLNRIYYEDYFAKSKLQ